MHLPKPFPGMRMRECLQGKSDYEKADPPGRERTGGEQPFQEREASGI